MHPWTAMSPLSPSSGAARGPGHQLLPPRRRAPMTPEQRQRSLQSILEAALDIMSSLDADVDDATAAEEEGGDDGHNTADSQPKR
jgi:hypothetical protein